MDADDLALRMNPQYRHLFEDQPLVHKPEVKWLKPHDGILNSACGRYQVRKGGDPLRYSLFNIRIVPFARLIREGFESFEQVKEFIAKQP